MTRGRRQGQKRVSRPYGASDRNCPGGNHDGLSEEGRRGLVQSRSGPRTSLRVGWLRWGLGETRSQGQDCRVWSWKKRRKWAWAALASAARQGLGTPTLPALLSCPTVLRPSSACRGLAPTVWTRLSQSPGTGSLGDRRCCPPNVALVAAADSRAPGDTFCVPNTFSPLEYPGVWKDDHRPQQFPVTGSVPGGSTLGFLWGPCVWSEVSPWHLAVTACSPQPVHVGRGAAPHQQLAGGGLLPAT